MSKPLVEKLKTLLQSYYDNIIKPKFDDCITTDKIIDGNDIEITKDENTGELTINSTAKSITHKQSWQMNGDSLAKKIAVPTYTLSTNKATVTDLQNAFDEDPNTSAHIKCEPDGSNNIILTFDTALKVSKIWMNCKSVDYSSSFSDSTSATFDFYNDDILLASHTCNFGVFSVSFPETEVSTLKLKATGNGQELCFRIYGLEFYNNDEKYKGNMIIENITADNLLDQVDTMNYTYLGLTQEDGIYTYDLESGQKVKVALGMNDVKSVPAKIKWTKSDW